MKLPLFAVVAFIVGLAGGTGVGVMTAPKPAAVADSTQAAHGADPHGAPGAAGGHDAAPAAAGGHAPSPVDSAHGPGAAHAADPPHAPSASPAHAASAPAGGPPHVVGADLEAVPASAAREPEDFQQVARILTTMKPTDAAKILAFLSDDHVEGVIRAVGPRQAAVLMVQIPAQRAAALSKRLIQHPTPEKR